jgi:WXG100 family type VII secretion target
VGFVVEFLGIEPMKVVPHELQGLCQSARAAADELASVFGSLEPDVTRVADGWSGAAGSEFSAHWHEVRSRSRVVIDGLSQISASLDGVRRGYTEADNSAADHIEVLNLD